MFKSIKTHLKDSKIFYKPVDTNTANILKDYLKGLKLSDSTIIVSLSKLQACYNLAKKKGKTLENTIFDTDGLTLNSKDVFFSKDEWTNFISLVKEEDYRNLFILMLNTGARIRELLTLTKDRVFLDTDTPHIFIPMELNKTRELKYIPLLCEDAKNSLKKLLSLSKTHFVINKSISAINYRIKHYAKLSNIARAEKMSCHTFRHTFITWAETGVFDFLNGKSMDSRLIKLTVGHSLNSNITENNYTHRQLEDYFKLLNKGN
ncbi:MAG: tyrosine-type recombinase/integrase [Defluviitaleaceae bacterium]|nr:tyrosine-type recombinase/integrase [Defluviitaleaceae bacterium]